MRFALIWHSKYGVEEVDSFDTRAEAQRMRAEYKMAFIHNDLKSISTERNCQLMLTVWHASPRSPLRVRTVTSTAGLRKKKQCEVGRSVHVRQV